MHNQYALYFQSSDDGIAECPRIFRLVLLSSRTVKTKSENRPEKKRAHHIAQRTNWNRSADCNGKICVNGGHLLKIDEHTINVAQNQIEQKQITHDKRNDDEDEDRPPRRRNGQKTSSAIAMHRLMNSLAV